MRCLSTVTNTKQQFNSSNNESNSSSLAKHALIGLSLAGAATAVGNSVLSDENSSSQCEPNVGIAATAPTASQILYRQVDESLKMILSESGRYLNNDNVNAPIIEKDQDLLYQPTPAATIPERVIDVMKASVDTASEWEKKAKETVRMMTNPSPKSYDVSVRAMKGSRLSMEDKYSIHNDGRFAAVFDGHGGSCVSTYLSEKLYEKINHQLINNEKKDDNDQDSISFLTKTMSGAFREVDEEILKIDDYQYQGSTAVAIWVHEDSDKGRTLVSANVGDSRAVLSHQKQAIDLTKDHKPNDAEERKRILAQGEKIEWDPYCNVHRVRNLSLSRAIGDRFAKPVVSGQVDIKTFPLNDTGGDDFVVLASDGLWDVFTSQECVHYINDRLNPSHEQMKNMSTLEAQRQKFTKRKNMSRFVANEALRRGSCDNVCVIIIWLNKTETPST